MNFESGSHAWLFKSQNTFWFYSNLAFGRSGRRLLEENVFFPLHEAARAQEISGVESSGGHAEQAEILFRCCPWRLGA